MKKLALGYLVSAMQAISSVALLASSAWLISRAAEQPSIMYLSLGIVGVRAFALGKAGFRYAERLVTHDATFEQVSDLRQSVFAKVIPLAPLGLGVSRGELLNALIRDVDDSQERTLRVIPVIVQVIAVTVAGTILFWFMLPQFAFWFFFVSVCAIACGVFATKRVESKAQHIATGERAMFSRMLVNQLEHQAILKAYGWESSKEKALAELDKSLTAMQIKSAHVAGLGSIVNLIATYGSVFIAMHLGAAAMAGHELSGVLFTVLVLTPLAIFEVYSQIGSATVANARFKASKLRLNELSSLEPGEFVGDDIGGSKTLEDFESLSFSSVVAKYQADSKPIHIPDFEVNRGDLLLISGPSGSGKSTIANLLVGFLNPVSGRIQVNGTSISEFSTSSLRERVGLLEQFPTVFSGSVRVNLQMAKPSATDAELVDALEHVHLWSTLSNREGLETQVGERGAQLSGGEVQRLAIARNLLAGHDLLVFDEPATGVDSNLRENLLLDMVQLTSLGKTVILISHDLPPGLRFTKSVTFG